jgi:hypothetical protein
MPDHYVEFDPASPCLVLAPHLEYPTRNGADILIDKKWAQFSKHVPFVDIIGKDAIRKYTNGKLVGNKLYKNTSISKTKAAVSTLLTRNHYLLQKNLTSDFIRTALPYLANPKYKTVVLSFIWTAALTDNLPLMGARLYCVETHNDELRCYENLKNSTNNPLAQKVAYHSGRWSETFLRRHESDFLYLHVSDADQRSYLDYLPNHASLVVPIGVDEVAVEPFRQCDPVPSEKVRLIFVGSLGVQMNLDALRYFRKRFYPLLRKSFGRNLEVLVVGSTPSKGIVRLCDDSGWTLHQDVSEQELRRLYRTATFSILPFPYTAGAKLKLLGSLAHGVPYLATSNMRDQTQDVPYPCLASDDPERWISHVQEVRRNGISNDSQDALLRVAQRFSWSAVASRMFESLISYEERRCPSQRSVAYFPEAMRHLC